eukprot:Gregarina_sp_Poly_1__11177@NODE_911_length_5744_cov_65_144619_g649_i0_p6_GENE_NODE_911_length_5744_cov_65_144619_g649_i0NODE_911_length_5744_cov_65_144619_g649_i0_p6_ORF_typecomplete_len105_score9_27DPM2/PF07297_12/1_1e12ARL6IP6/PF15062_6/5_1e03ARL6IP6/PF15062_6/0_13_NODE_911_length_5744_cov_65_144619_g649_i014131727
MHKLFPMVLWITSFTYYSCWVLLSPFLDEDQPLQKLFPSRKYALLTSDIWACCIFGFCAFTYGWYIYYGDSKLLFGKYGIESEISRRSELWLAHHKAISKKLYK